MEGGFVAVVIGLIIGIILIVAIAMPIVSQTIYTFNGSVVNGTVFGGITGTILTYLLPFLAIGALILVAKAVIGY